MRFAFIAKHRSIWPVAWLCEALDMSRSGFHAWLTRAPSVRSRHDEALLGAIDRSFKSSDRTYCARRVWHDVLRARPCRRGLPKATGERTVVSQKLLDRAFEASAPNRKWQIEFTYFKLIGVKWTCQ